MENQHRKITGYRELTQAEIDLMNDIKAKGRELEDLIYRLREAERIEGACDSIEASRAQEANRWISIGQTHLQQGLMALTRAVAKPESF